MSGRRSPFITRLHHFAGSSRAMAATEFALILPLLILLYIGCVDTTQAITVDRKVSAAINAVGDLVAQGGTIQAAEMDDIFRAATETLIPYDASPLSMIVSSVLVTDSGGEVLCSKAFETTPYAVGAAIDVPQNVAREGATVVVAEGRYDFTPLFGHVITQTITLSDTYYLRPRTVDEVKFAGC